MENNIALNFGERTNYASTYHGGKNASVPCYTKKQMRSLYPTGRFELLGEFAPKSKQKQIGSLAYEGKKLRLCRPNTNSRVTYAEKGFVAVEGSEDSYVVLLQRVLITRCVLLALCLAILAGAALLVMNWSALFPTVADRTPDLEEGAVAWEGARNQDTGGVTEGIAIPGYKKITIDADTTAVKVNFQNPEGNPCYFVISLLLDDGTELYKSKMIEPGLGLYDITLNQPLKEGEYGATIKYETFSLDTISPLNGAEVKITLIAE